MSTYAVIAIKRPNGTVNLARLLQDGDPENAGTILCSAYKTTEQVENFAKSKKSLDLFGGLIC